METKNVTFVRLGFKDKLAKIIDGSNKAKWCYFTDSSYDYAKSLNIQENETVTIEYEVGGSGRKPYDWTIVKIYRVGGVTQTVAPLVTTTTVTQSQQAPVSGSTGTVKVDSPEIVAENITTAVSRGLIAMQGQVSPTNVEGLIQTLYSAFRKYEIETIKILKSNV